MPKGPTQAVEAAPVGVEWVRAAVLPADDDRDEDHDHHRAGDECKDRPDGAIVRTLSDRVCAHAVASPSIGRSAILEELRREDGNASRRLRLRNFLGSRVTFGAAGVAFSTSWLLGPRPVWLGLAGLSCGYFGLVALNRWHSADALAERTQRRWFAKRGSSDDAQGYREMAACICLVGGACVVLATFGLLPGGTH